MYSQNNTSNLLIRGSMPICFNKVRGILDTQWQL
jgi:hypothetical protein